MKKIKTFFALFVASAMFFVSCDEIETSDFTLDLSQTATVRAYIYANLDNTSLGAEAVPNGTRVIISIPNSSFNAGASGTWTDTATVTSGYVEATVPTVDAGVTVSFQPDEFTYDQVQAYGSNSTTIPKIFKQSVPSTLGAVKPGQSRTHQFTYNTETSLTSFTETVDLVFEADAVTNETTGSADVPSGIVVNIYTSTFATTATVGAAGVFSASVPKSTTITLRFETTKTLIGPPADTQNYRYTDTYFTPSTSTPVKVPLDFGVGILWE